MNIPDKFKQLLTVPYPSQFIDGDIPVFCPRPAQERAGDKYDKDFEMVNRYTGTWAFGYQLLDLGGTEAVYRTVDSLLLSSLDNTKEHLVLDIGCGVGRTLYDCAELYPSSLFVGMDYAYNMAQRAKKVLLGGGSIDVDLSEKGWGKVNLKCKTLNSNVIVAQGSVLDLPFHPNAFDCVVNTYLIDRVKEPEKAIEQMASVLKPGGIFILTNPLNFELRDSWKRTGSRDAVMRIIENQGIRIADWFDGLVYREMEDARGNHRDWMTLVVCGIKDRGNP